MKVDFTGIDKPLDAIRGWDPRVVNNLDPSLIEFVKMMKKRLKRDWDFVIGVTGRSGKGKSTLINGWITPLIDGEFSLKGNVEFIPEAKDIKERFHSLKQHQVMVIDEAVRALHKYGWGDKLQQTVVEMYDTERCQNKGTFCLMPSWNTFTSHFRNFRIDVWIDVIWRGHAVVYGIDEDKDIDDPWHLKENQKYKKKAFKKTNVGDKDLYKRLEVERKLPNYIMDFEFPDWSDWKTKREYQDLKTASRVHEERREEEQTLQHRWKIRTGCAIYNIMLQKVDTSNLTVFGETIGMKDFDYPAVRSCVEAYCKAEDVPPLSGELTKMRHDNDDVKTKKSEEVE